jgi:GNAT superfamily N-acetyltransferase
MDEVVLRAVGPGDGNGLARVWIDGARHYVELDRDHFRLPSVDGLARWLEVAVQSPDTYGQVAIVDGDLVGHIWAAVQRPSSDAPWQMLTDLGRIRLTLHWLGVLTEFRRRGIGRRLLQSAEDWGRQQGAERAGFSTYLGSPLSVPFYEDRMGYQRHGVYLTKRL